MMELEKPSAGAVERLHVGACGHLSKGTMPGIDPRCDAHTWGPGTLSRDGGWLDWELSGSESRAGRDRLRLRTWDQGQVPFIGGAKLPKSGVVTEGMRRM